MRCIVYGGTKNPLKELTRNPPRAGRRGRVLVKVHAVGLNPVDAKDVMGDKLPHSWTWARSSVQSMLKNRIVGFDFAGTVAEDHSVQFRRGDKVFGNMPPLEGTLAEYISVPLDQICHTPTTKTFVEAAALPLVGLTALQSLSPYVVTNDTSVLVLGASGGTGHVAVQVARHGLGAAHVTAVCSGRNADFCRDQCGATHVVDYTLDHGSQDTLYRNLQQAPGYPFHVVLDCVTSADPADRQVDYPSLIRQKNRATTNAKATLLVPDYKYLRLGGPTPDWVRAGVERVCFGLDCWPDKHEKLFWIRFPKSSHELQQLREWASEGKLMVQVAETVPFTAQAVQAAFDRILERRVQGKIVVEIVPQEQAQSAATDVLSPSGVVS
ncbi:furan-3-one reductase [Seminavis robusta]|uniref:Furan-3-one reductase n=1 Tax=Seminavis robusta TaxID=568900 RepID=A0A9N8HUE3_9STRA|nr:furan-3-one reductase [Seminavis robusta]|eukprot:Sro2055_g312810.1 furan-3-one reductase (381) ;mRNA; r:7539-8827